MKNFILTTLVYIFTFFCTAFVGNHFIQEGFGRSDIGPLLFWGLPGILIGSLVIAKISQINFGNPFLKYPTLIGVAFMCALGTTAAYPMLLGVWFGALSIPPFLPSLAGALGAAFAVPTLRSDDRLKFLKVAALLLFLVFFFAIGVPKGYAFRNTEILKGGRVLTASARLGQQGLPVDVQKLISEYCPSYQYDQMDWDKNSAIPSEGYLLEHPCSTAALKTLVSFHQSVGVDRAMKLPFISGRLAQYENTNASIIMAFGPEFHLPANGMELALPDQTSVIYYHTPEGWQIFPKDAKVSKRKVKISRSFMEVGDGTQTPILCLSVEDVNGRFDGPECANVLPEGVKLEVDPPLVD